MNMPGFAAEASLDTRNRGGLYGMAENSRAAGEPLTFGGTSAAAPFVSGAAALLWSEFPGASAAAVKCAPLHGAGAQRTSIAPPLLDASAAYQALAGMQAARRAS
jgi:subtilisin family serine protease